MGEVGPGYESRSFTAGRVIFREGDPGREAYLIKRGRVTLSRLLEGTETVLDTLTPGAVFGEMAVLGEGPRSATAVAAEEAELVVIDQ
jgi:CRP-like cAMP-binding protein